MVRTLLQNVNSRKGHQGKIAPVFSKKTKNDLFFHRRIDLPEDLSRLQAFFAA